MLNKNVKEFVERLLRTRRVVVYVESFKPQAKLYGEVTDDMLVPNRDDKISLTQEIGENGIRYHTNFTIPFLYSEAITSLSNQKLKRALQKNAHYIEIIMKEQGDTSLDRLVLDCLIEMGL
jgi:hypothetical protein